MSLFRSLTVLSIEQATTLPFLTLRLALDGARVIRIENPPHGDPNRWVGPQVLPTEKSYEEGMNAYFLPNNLGKQSITLNLGSQEGREVLYKMVGEFPVDIFATNQRPRSLDKLGIDYDTLSKIKPDLIYVSITGFGPESNEAAYDPILQARSGMMALTGEPEGDPMVFGLPIVDLGAGEHAYGQVMKALYKRSETGEGSKIDISMFQSAVSWANSPAMLSNSFDIPIRRKGNTHRFFAPVSVFPTSDGNVYLAVGTDRQWEAITKLPGYEALEQEPYCKNEGRIKEVVLLTKEISKILITQSTQEVLAQFNKIGVPISPVNDLGDVCADPLIREKMIWARDPISGIRISIPPPPVVSDVTKQNNFELNFPPRLGEHNQAVYEALDYEVSELSEKGVI